MKLSPACEAHLAIVFPDAEDRDYARTLLEETCGERLPGHERATASSLDRIRFAVLKVSGGSLEAFDRAVDLARVDWRDLLVAADFAHDVEAHRAWDPRADTPSPRPPRPPRPPRESSE